MSGGLSHLSRLLLRKYCFNFDGVHLQRHGVELPLEDATGRKVRLFVNVVRMLNDEVALMELILCMGHFQEMMKLYG